MKCSFIVACNNEEILRSSLLASPDLNVGIEIIVERGHISAGAAYNAGLRKASGDILVFIHQDVFLPPGWLQTLINAATRIEINDPGWGVLGVFGSGLDGSGQGHIFSTGLRRFIGAPFAQPVEVQTLDEVVLVLRRTSGLGFDEHLPGFHLYGSDICLLARSLGRKCYAIPAFCLHNTNGITFLPRSYWKAWLYMRSKWRSRLPIMTPCMPITRWGAPAIRYLTTHSVSGLWRINRSGHRVDNPAALFSQLALRP